MFAGLALIPLMKYDKGERACLRLQRTQIDNIEGRYSLPLHIAPPALIIGFILYALASPLSAFTKSHGDIANNDSSINAALALILLGRCTQGLGFSFWMYAKRYCSDPRIVGIRRRTTLAAWLVLGQGVGMGIGPGVGGWLFRAGGGGENGLEGKAGVWFNGYTAPAWVMAGVWALFWGGIWRWFEDLPKHEDTRVHLGLRPQGQIATPPGDGAIPTARSDPSATPVSLSTPSFRLITRDQWRIILTMCWFAMTCFFILGAWESNIPVFAAPPSSPTSPHHANLGLRFSPFASGNFIALGGLAVFPFLLLSLLASHSARNSRFLRLRVNLPISLVPLRHHSYSRQVSLTLSPHLQDRTLLALGTLIGLAGVLSTFALLRLQTVSERGGVSGFFACWFLVALGFNLASTCTLSLLSKRMGGEWNGVISLGESVSLLP